MPALSRTVVYGALSEVIHNDHFNKVIMSNLSNEDYKCFMLCLSKYYKKSMIEFDEMQSELDEEII